MLLTFKWLECTVLSIVFVFKLRILGLGCSSVVQLLPSMCEALGLIPAPKKKRPKKKKNLSPKLRILIFFPE
jgi:hypothetical protein